MPRNGSGTYTLPLSAVVPDTTILASWANTTLDDVALAMTNSIAKNGETNPTAALPMNGFNHTGVAVANARTQYARAAEVIDGLLTRCTAVGGTADAITMAAPLSTNAYVEGQRFSFTTGAGANTGAVTVNVNGIGTRALTKRGATALAAGDLPAGARVLMEYDGTQFQLLAPFVTAADVVATVGISFDSGNEIVWRGATIPAGWANLSLDNHAIRIMGTPAADAGTVDFVTAFASQAVAGTNTAEAAHTHPFTAIGTISASSSWAQASGADGANSRFWSNGANPPTFNFSGSASSTSAGTNHTHVFTGTAINLAVKRHDMQVIQKI
jgi:hypothetical protein